MAIWSLRSYLTVWRHHDPGRAWSLWPALLLHGIEWFVYVDATIAIYSCPLLSHFLWHDVALFYSNCRSPVRSYHLSIAFALSMLMITALMVWWLCQVTQTCVQLDPLVASLMCHYQIAWSLTRWPLLLHCDTTPPFASLYCTLSWSKWIVQQDRN